MTPGTLLKNRYRIRGVLGEGGMSRVYLADDLQFDALVAIKENLQTNPESRRQFAQEAAILARLSHPNLPRVFDHFVDAQAGQQYLVMEYVEGEDLEAMIKRVGPLPEVTALAWIRQILNALEYLHLQKPPVIHRDIKPSNIKVTPQGKVVLVDFGIAKVYDPRVGTMTGARAVTPGYTSPEQYGMRTDERSDIYSLGATLYTMLTGRVPPEAPLRTSGAETLIQPRRVVPGVSPNLESAVLRAMELNTSRRWQTVAQLHRVLDTGGTAQSPITRGRTTPAQQRGATAAGEQKATNRFIVIVALASVAAIVLVAFVSILAGIGLFTIVPTPTVPMSVAVALPSARQSPTQRATSTTIPTGTPIVMPVTRAPTTIPTSIVTSTPDLASAVLGPKDLPKGFEAMSPDDLRRLNMTESDLTRAFASSVSQARPQNYVAFVNSSPLEIVISFLLYPLSPLEKAMIDVELSDPDSLLRSFAGGLSGTGSVGRSGLLPGMDKLGDKSVGIMFVVASGSVPVRADIVIARRGAVIEFLMAFYLDGIQPLIGIDDLARIVDSRVVAALK